jgi:hypothetical protein
MSMGWSLRHEAVYGHRSTAVAFARLRANGLAFRHTPTTSWRVPSLGLERLALGVTMELLWHPRTPRSERCTRQREKVGGTGAEPGSLSGDRLSLAAQPLRWRRSGGSLITSTIRCL